MKSRKTRRVGSLYKRGWFGDQWRHSLAARGIKTGRKKKFQMTQEELKKRVGGYASISAMILADLHRARRPLTTKQISDRIGISWITVKAELAKLQEERKISVKRERSRLYWETS